VSGPLLPAKGNKKGQHCNVVIS